VGIHSIGGRRAAVFFDRDGVLNKAAVRDGRPYPPASVDELEIVWGASAAVRKLRDLGFLIVVVTNQPDVGRGTQTRAEVEKMNAAIGRSIAIDDFLVCYHDDGDGCDCRKPAPGLLLRAAAQHEIELASSYMVGDRWRDVEAGSRAGCKTILIDFGYRERSPAKDPDARVKSLDQAVDWIVANHAIEGQT
jgi:D-glycero-D-manno-heptose 1,7-bisphosphate phosphatase